MKLHRVSLLRKLLKDAHGQTLVMMAVSMVALIGVAGVATDLGHTYYARQQLQASTNAAALAGAAALPDTTAATTAVTTYSAVSGGLNANASLTNVSLGSTPSFLCLGTLTSNMGLGCATSTGSTTGSYNAIKVTQTAKVPLWFGGMFKVPAFNIAATATAAMSGGQNTPWNIAIILDATGSMNDQDSGLQCSGTQESCALLGIQAMLGLMYPCAQGTTCTSSSTPVDAVSLFVFPPVLTSQAKYFYSCTRTVPTYEPYTFQNVSTTSPNYNLPVTYTYQVVPTPAGTTGNTISYFSTDYRTSDTATTLNSASQLAIASGGISGCSGVKPSRDGTYYAQAIYAAQAALVAQQAKYPGSQNAMIILGDGDSNSDAELKAQTGTLNGTGSGSNEYSYAYPSSYGECGQAIIAAQAAATTPNANGVNGTRVYTIAYGALTSGTCDTDTTITVRTGSGRNATTTQKVVSAYPNIQACTVMQDMASSPGYFYSDDANGCSSTNQVNFTKLTQIFQAISRNLTSPRLVPNGTT